MNNIFNILFSDLAICCYEGVLFGIVFIRFIKLRKEKKHVKEMSILQKEKIRENRLDDVLKNKLYQGTEEDINQKNLPYEVDFHEEEKNSVGIVNKKNKINIKNRIKSLEIIEKGKLATRKYVVFLNEPITIGQGENNKLVIKDLKVAKNQCKIFEYADNIFIQSLEDTHPVELYRKQNKMKLSKDAVNLCSDDIIKMGETILKIQFI